MEHRPYPHLFSFLLLVSLFVLPAAIDQALADSESGLEEYVQAEGLLRAQFYENLGQFPDNSVKYYGAIPGGFVGFSDDAVLLWSRDDPNPVRMAFVNSADCIVPEPSDEVAHKTNYFLGNRGTFTNVRGYHNIVYANLWNNVDLSFDARRNGVEYEFIVRPGGDPAQIAMRFEGHETLRAERSSIVIDTPGSGFIHDGLLAYHGKTEVDAQFAEKAHGVLGFDVGLYDRCETLVIDPLIYSTYIGGAGSESGSSIAVDSEGNAFVCGFTDSLDFPTLGAYERSLSSTDCFILKVSSSGESLLYSTFVGGSGDEWGTSIDIDSAGNAYVFGDTMSPDFPTINADDDSYNGGSDYYGDCFILKLNATGNSLLYSTFLGGSSDDNGNSIAVDSAGSAYMCGRTVSTDFPSISAYDSTLNGTDSFIVKLNAAGNSLLYSTFIGGNDGDAGVSIDIDSDGNAYVCGMTSSSDFPTLSAYDESYNGGSESDGSGDCFVLKLNASGDTLLYSTYIGGESVDWGNSIAVDSAGSAYVCGTTNSPDFPTANAYDSSFGGGDPKHHFYDCFVLKVNATGNSLLYSTFVHGRYQEWGNSIAIDSAGNAFVCGETSSSDFPIVNADDSLFNRTSMWYDCFVLELSPAGDSLLYSVVMGDGGIDRGISVAVDPAGGIFVCGHTTSSTFPMVNAYDSSLGGASDCFIAKVTVGPQRVDPYLQMALAVGMAGVGVAVVVVPFVVWTRRSRGPV